ncbi:MAG: hypothetical protein B0A82_16615 [Alkalinema sp. CACIAM 70d]|nr:MAG: hypothetical protein B0A82_16615 [Alkalinema sp. CACIAM 70d]
MNTRLKAWELVQLQDLSHRITKGTTPTSLGLSFTDEGILFVKVESLREGRINKDLCAFIDEDAHQVLERSQLQENDILFSIAGTLGRVAIVQKEDLPANTNQALAIIRLAKSINPEYISLALSSRVIEESIRQGGRGVGLRNLNLQQVSEFTIPLPPLNEQKRIVAKIEELRSKTQKAREALEVIPELCDRFRQSVLAAAFRGDLTADWREQNPDVEPASVLLERIKRKRLLEAKTEKQKQVLLEAYAYEEEYGDEVIPEEWQYIALDKLCYSFQYGTSAKSLSDGSIPVLRMGNLQNGEIDWDNLVYTSNEDEISKYSLNPGDVLFNRTNSPELVGKTSIYRGERPAIFAGYLIRINNSSELDSEYLNYCLNSNYAKDYCWQVKTDGVSQSNINAQKLAKFEIPFCSIEEQREIAKQIKGVLQIISRIQQKYQSMESYLASLDRAILAKAFRGELVEQDPTDEPASVLLERIRTERATATPKPSKTRKKAKA